MGFLTDFFAGAQTESESSAAAKTGTQTGLLDEIIRGFQSQATQGQPNVFQGQRVAPLGSLTQSALTAAEGIPSQIGGASPLIGEAGSALSQILSQQTGASLVGPESVDAFIESAIRGPRVREFERFTAPLIQEQFAGPGFQSTARAREVGRAGERLAQDIGSESAAARLQAEQFNTLLNTQIQEAAANRALSAISPALQTAGFPTAQAGAQTQVLGSLAQLGTLEQGQRQAEINANIQRFAEENRQFSPEDFQLLALLLNADFSTSSASSLQTEAGLGNQFLGGFLGQRGQTAGAGGGTLGASLGSIFGA